MHQGYASTPLAEKRQYVRLQSIFPVEFMPVSLSADRERNIWQQGYTCNISDGGLCLEAVSLDAAVLAHVSQKVAVLDLRIRIPLFQPPVRAIAEVAWLRREEGAYPPKYFLGLQFRSIVSRDLARITRSAQWFRHAPPVYILAGVGIGMGIMVFLFLFGILR